MDLLTTFKYDPATGVIYWRQARGNRPAGGVAGHREASGYVRIAETHLAAHRLAWFLMTGQHPIGPIDHVNGVRDDNRWSNLRLSTPQLNSVNRRSQNAVGFKGVAKVGARFQAQIKVGTKNHYLGLFDTAEQAAAAYRAASEARFGPIDRALA